MHGFSKFPTSRDGWGRSVLHLACESAAVELSASAASASTEAGDVELAKRLVLAVDEEPEFPAVLTLLCQPAGDGVHSQQLQNRACEDARAECTTAADTNGSGVSRELDCSVETGKFACKLCPGS